MEQYIHLLIPDDAKFTPSAGRVAEFFEQVITKKTFEVVTVPPWQPGLTIGRPTGRNRKVKNAYTGEMMELKVPEMERPQLQNPSEIANVVERLTHYSVRLSGQWSALSSPIQLFMPDGALFDKPCVCTVGCEQRSEPVTMSDLWNEEERTARGILRFGEACAKLGGPGYFMHVRDGSTIEVSGAGCARFWIEFEFGKFLFPRMGSGLDLLDQSFLAMAEQTFGINFNQGCRYY